MSCIVCANQVVSGLRAKYCSPACRTKDWRKNNSVLVAIHVKDRQAKLRAITKVKLRSLPLAYCVICLNTLSPKSVNSKATTCSKVCAIKRDTLHRTPEQILATRKRAKAKNPNAFKDLAQNNRAMRKSRFKAKVYRAEIYARDNYLCQLCFEPLLMNERIPAHPKSDCCEMTCFKAPTIDHIIPLANGGWHEPANVQAAHFICNSRKSNKSETLETELQ